MTHGCYLTAILCLITFLGTVTFGMGILGMTILRFTILGKDIFGMGLLVMTMLGMISYVVRHVVSVIQKCDTMCPLSPCMLYCLLSGKRTLVRVQPLPRHTGRVDQLIPLVRIRHCWIESPQSLAQCRVLVMLYPLNEIEVGGGASPMMASDMTAFSHLDSRFSPCKMSLPSDLLTHR